MTTTHKSLPLPLVAAAAPADDEAPAYLPMPQGMATFHAPALPEPEQLAAHGGCVRVLREAVAALRRPDALRSTQVIDLGALGAADRTLLNQVLGEGEVAAQVTGDSALQVQESVFAGVWRVLHLQGGRTLRDTLEVGTLPQGLVDAAGGEWRRVRPALPPPAGLMNAPAVLAELEDHARCWQPQAPAHVVNLTLLPLSAEDVAHLDARLGSGRVLILSRGYGNCRITNTTLPHTWRVTYFNSTDIVILDTLEVCRVPEVACAAAEDLADSATRVAEVLQWVHTMDPA